MKRTAVPGWGQGMFLSERRGAYGAGLREERARRCDRFSSASSSLSPLESRVVNGFRNRPKPRMVSLCHLLSGYGVVAEYTWLSSDTQLSDTWWWCIPLLSHGSVRTAHSTGRGSCPCHP